jgi:hypothetical protein
MAVWTNDIGRSYFPLFIGFIIIYNKKKNSIVGPVFVEFPIDVLYPYEVVYSQLGVKEKGSVSFVQRIVNWWVNMVDSQKYGNICHLNRNRIIVTRFCFSSSSSMAIIG